MKNKLRIEIILACKIHTMEEAFGGGPMGGVEKKSYERKSESHSIP